MQHARTALSLSPGSVAELIDPGLLAKFPRMLRILMAALLAATALGCPEEEPVSPANPTGLLGTEPLVRAHWLGTTGLSSNTNAAYLLSIWNLPEAAPFKQHLLTKLASAPAQILAPQTNAASLSAVSAWWRPFLQDLLKNETFLDVRRTAGTGLEGAIAVRLDTNRAKFWQAFLDAAFTSTPGVSRVAGLSNAWALAAPSGSLRAHLGSVDGWMTLKFGQTAESASYFDALLNTEPLLEATGTNHWLRIEADLAALNHLAKSPLATASLPRVEFSACSEGGNVRTAAKLTFSNPLTLPLEPWTLPTNVIHNPLLSFTAARGLRPWLGSFPVLGDLGRSALPDQLFFWSLHGGAILSFAAAPLSNASAFVDVAGPALARWTPWLTNHAQGTIQYDATNHSVMWNALPVFTPGFLSVTSNVGDLLLGKIAFMMPRNSDEAFPGPLMEVLDRGTDIVYYHWEITENRLADIYPTLQALRLAIKRSTLPMSSPSMTFLSAIGPRLGNAVTVVRHAKPAELTVERKSHSGLTALEWHLLGDWLESPTFPRGLHTFTAQDRATLYRQQLRQRNAAATNNPAAK